MLNPEDEVKGQKSEKLIERIIDAHVKPGDIVLDFFAGSGTTGAVAHKKNIQYILCEQLEKHIDIMKRRLVEVIKGEQSGISRRNNWKGGGSFVYCELAKSNESFMEEIEQASSSETLKLIWKKIQETGFLSYRVKIENINESVSDFEALELEDQKRFLIECLDKNMLYIPLSDMESEEYKISEEDKRHTNEFYKKMQA